MYEVIGQSEGPYNVIAVAGGEGLKMSAGTISDIGGDDLSSVSKQFPIIITELKAEIYPGFS